MSHISKLYHYLKNNHYFHPIEEQDDGGWHENRDQIELILMKKSIKFARAVVKEFEKLNGGKAIEDILTENIQNCDLNENLADTYASLGPLLYICTFQQAPQPH